MERLDRRGLLKILGLGLGACALGCIHSGGRAQDTPRRPPNVLFIISDDLRPELGCYGHDWVVSPNIDRLAKEGFLFERAYCQVPTCGPSRASVLTGLRPRDVSTNEWRADEQGVATMAGWFGRHGYHCISNGKISHHVTDAAGDWSEKPWRESVYATGAGGADWANARTSGLWQNPASREQANERTGRGPYCESADVADEDYQDGRLAAKCIDDLKRLAAMDQPFLLACGFYRPHLPFNAPARYWDLYERDEVEIAGNRYRPASAPDQLRQSGEINAYARVEGRKSDEDFHREARHAYYACVSFVDAQIGRVLKALEDLGLADDTIVVLWGDHGWHLGEHDFWGKHNTLHNAVHSPLIVRAPGMKGGRRTASLVEFVDIYPSLCELAGLESPGHFEGDSFAPLLHDPDRPWKEAAFTAYGPGRAVITARYTYTEYGRGGRVAARMLYDRAKDPEENANVVDDPAYADAAKEMAAMLEAGWQAARPS